MGYAIQLRVNAETVNAEGVALPAGGVIGAFDPPGGPGIRLDTAACTGLAINPNFDSLLAKLIVRSSAPSFAAAVARGLFGVPTMEACGRLYWGLDALPMLRAYLQGDAWFDGPDWQAPAQCGVGVRRA